MARRLRGGAGARWGRPAAAYAATDFLMAAAGSGLARCSRRQAEENSVQAPVDQGLTEEGPPTELAGTGAGAAAEQAGPYPADQAAVVDVTRRPAAAAGRQKRLICRWGWPELEMPGALCECVRQRCQHWSPVTAKVPRAQPRSQLYPTWPISSRVPADAAEVLAQ